MQGRVSMILVGHVSESLHIFSRQRIVCMFSCSRTSTVRNFKLLAFCRTLDVHFVSTPYSLQELEPKEYKQNISDSRDNTQARHDQRDHQREE